ncbi:MAG: DegT/DnrJ/EryC1/StrS family aminotransferase [Planctomycetia bacterium]|nr:DegT/DnrJ/EryC1/StrS family aminotransferase [Planctomycetia bacterium]
MISDQAYSPVPLLDLSRQYKTIQAEMDQAILDVNTSGMFVLGPEVKKLEQAIMEYSRTKYAIGCASGSDALLLALLAYKIGPGDEVIVPSFTFFATASCVARLGATPVFADIDPITFNLDPKDVDAKITSRTKAIIPVHLFGQVAEMEALQKITKNSADPARQKIALVEDAAQAIGADLNDIRTGSWGDFSCLSFYPTKNLGGAGDGGMLLTNDEKLAHEVQILRVHGMEPRYYHHKIGLNSRLDAYQAAVLNVKLPHLDDWTDKRTANAARYQTLFADAGLDTVLGLPQKIGNRRHVWNQYVVRIPDGKRDQLRQYLLDHKIGCDIYYPLGLHEQVCFKYLNYAPEDLPETWKATREVLALPIYPELRSDEQEIVVRTIRSFFDK